MRGLEWYKGWSATSTIDNLYKEISVGKSKSHTFECFIAFGSPFSAFVLLESPKLECFSNRIRKLMHQDGQIAALSRTKVPYWEDQSKTHGSVVMNTCLLCQMLDTSGSIPGVRSSAEYATRVWVNPRVAPHPDQTHTRGYGSGF